MALIDQMTKPLTGQYSFLQESDRLSTLNNLRLGGTTVVPTKDADGYFVCDGSLGSSFLVTMPAVGGGRLSVANIADGQTIRILVINRFADGFDGVITFPTTVASVRDTAVAVAVNKAALFTLTNVGGLVSVVESALGDAPAP